MGRPVRPRGLPAEAMMRAEAANVKMSVPVPKQSREIRPMAPPAPVVPKATRAPVVPAKPGLTTKQLAVPKLPAAKAKSGPPKAAKPPKATRVAKYPKHYTIVNHLSDSWLHMLVWLAYGLF